MMATVMSLVQQRRQRAGGEGGGEASTKRKCVNSLNIHVYLRAVCI